MKAQDRFLPDWFARINQRQITLPRFQRSIAWYPALVADLLTAVLRGLPTGAVLILEVGDEEKFESRTITDAPVNGGRVTEQLLDGQQRLTALWRSLNDKYPDRTYFVAFDETEPGMQDGAPRVVGVTRWKEAGRRYPMWADDPTECWARGLIPLRLLRPGDDTAETTRWLDLACPVIAARGSTLADTSIEERFERNRALHSRIAGLQTIVREFNLPFLALPPSTPRSIALNVFIKLNTSFVRLSPYQIVVALVEDETGMSLPDHVRVLDEAVPRAKAYCDLSGLALNVVSLHQDREPSQSGYEGLKFNWMLENWSQVVDGVRGMVEFIEAETIYDGARLPSVTPLAVIAAQWPHLPSHPDKLGNARRLLRKYLWRAFLTIRYQQSSASGALQDYRGLLRILVDGADESVAPILRDASYPPPSVGAIAAAGWPKGQTILGRGLLALQIRCGAEDLADGVRASWASITSASHPREYHHLFPDSLLREAGLEKEKIFRSANCALLTWRTNRVISNKDPVAYLRERSEQNTRGEAELKRRLQTHLIPFDELAVGYAELDESDRLAKIRLDYDRFLQARANLLAVAARLAVDGQPIDYSDIFRLQADGAQQSV
jgi:hypothetical protein